MAIQKLSGENDMESLKKTAPGLESSRIELQSCHTAAIVLCHCAISAPSPDIFAVLSFGLDSCSWLLSATH